MWTTRDLSTLGYEMGCSDPVAGTLTVEVHRMGSDLQNVAIAHLCTVSAPN